MTPSPSPFTAIAITPARHVCRESVEPRSRVGGRRFMSPIDVVETGLMILLGTTFAAALVVFLASLAATGAIAAARWALALGAHPAVHVMSLVEFSAVGGAILGAMAVAIFAADLRRQRWL